VDRHTQAALQIVDERAPFLACPNGCFELCERVTVEDAVGRKVFPRADDFVDLLELFCG
jgi:hypothetical protein